MSASYWTHLLCRGQRRWTLHISLSTSPPVTREGGGALADRLFQIDRHPLVACVRDLMSSIVWRWIWVGVPGLTGIWTALLLLQGHVRSGQNFSAFLSLCGHSLLCMLWSGVLGNAVWSMRPCELFITRRTPCGLCITERTTFGLCITERTICGLCFTEGTLCVPCFTAELNDAFHSGFPLCRWKRRSDISVYSLCIINLSRKMATDNDTVSSGAQLQRFVPMTNLFVLLYHVKVYFCYLELFLQWSSRRKPYYSSHSIIHCCEPCTYTYDCTHLLWLTNEALRVKSSVCSVTVILSYRRLTLSSDTKYAWTLAGSESEG